VAARQRCAGDQAKGLFNSRLPHCFSPDIKGF
jgi:hypothetical protein